MRDILVSLLKGQRKTFSSRRKEVRGSWGKLFKNSVKLYSSQNNMGQEGWDRWVMELVRKQWETYKNVWTENVKGRLFDKSKKQRHFIQFSITIYLLTLAFLGAFVTLQEATISFVMSVRPSVHVELSSHLGRILLKLDILVFSENLSKQSSFNKTQKKKQRVLYIKKFSYLW